MNCNKLLSIHEESSDIGSSDSNDYRARYRAAQGAAWWFNVKENKQFSYNFALIAMQSIAWRINVEENSLFSKNRRRKASLVGFVLKNKIDDRQERIDDLWNQRIQNFILLTLVVGYIRYQLGWVNTNMLKLYKISNTYLPLVAVIGLLVGCWGQSKIDPFCDARHRLLDYC